MKAPGLPRAIQQLRTVRGLKIGKAAQLTGVHRATWHRWENGETQPRTVELESMLTALQADEQERQHFATLLNSPRARMQRQVEIISIARQQDWGPMPNAGDLLKAMRLRRGLSLDAVASAMQITTRTLRRWENTDVWPSGEAIGRLCQILHAYPGEVDSLTSGALSPNGWQDRSLEALAEQARILKLPPASEAAYKLSELHLIVLESQLWPSVARSEAARELMADTYTTHAFMTMEQGRIAGMRDYARRAESLLSRTPRRAKFWLRAKRRFIEASIQHEDGSLDVSGIQAYQRLLPYAQIPSEQRLILTRIALLQIQEGAIYGALDNMERAYQAALQSDDPDQLRFFQYGMANVLQKAGQSARALPLLGNDPYRKPDEIVNWHLTRAKIYFDLNEMEAATRDLQICYGVIEDYNLPFLKLDVAEATRQL